MVLYELNLVLFLAGRRFEQYLFFLETPRRPPPSFSQVLFERRTLPAHPPMVHESTLSIFSVANLMVGVFVRLPHQRQSCFGAQGGCAARSAIVRAKRSPPLALIIKKDCYQTIRFLVIAIDFLRVAIRYFLLVVVIRFQLAQVLLSPRIR